MRRTAIAWFSADAGFYWGAVADSTSHVLQVSQLEFSRDRKMMSVRCRRQNQDTLFVKGAPEAVLARCSQVSQGKTCCFWFTPVLAIITPMLLLCNI